MKKEFVLAALMVVFSLLMGCSSNQPTLIGKTHCQPIKKAPVIDNNMIINFAQKDILLIPKGNILRVVIPDDKFFRNNLPAIKPEKYTDLNQLAELLAKYQGCSVKVMGYSDDINNTADSRTQSLNRARAILTYLWTRGIDAENLYAVGYGQSYTVGDTHTVLSNAANNRVEIVVHAGCGSCL